MVCVMRQGKVVARLTGLSCSHRVESGSGLG